MGSLLHITRAFAQLRTPARQAVESAAEIERETPVSSRSLLADPYIRLIFAMNIFFGLGSYFVDNIFYMQVERHLTNQDQLAGFLGAFSGVVGGLSLLSQLFIAPRLLGAGAPLLGGQGSESIADALPTLTLECERSGEDLLVSARMREW